jgi:hypothetical protein
MLAARTTAFLRGVMVAALLLAAACESMPVQEMSDARQAIMAAKEAGAEEHAAEALLAAEESLHSAEKYLNSGNYAIARREAVDAKSKAIDALRVSEASVEDPN